MDMLCPAPGGGSACTVRALAAGLHSLHLYCVIIFLTLIWCCAPAKSHRHGKQWRAQNVRGVANLAIFAVWLMGVASAALRPTRTVQLVSASMAVLAWFAAAAFHVLLWSRASAAPTFYLAIYWLMAAASSSSIVWQHTMTQFSIDHIEIYIHTASALLALIVFGVDCLCFYDEVTNSFENHEKISDRYPNISYTYNYTHFFSKITFFWLNRILYKGYESPLDESDLGELPENELPRKYFEKFRHIFYAQNSQGENGRMGVNLWRCYVRMIWPNFYIAGVMKLFGDVVGIVPPLGLAVIIQFVEREKRNYDENSHVTVNEFFTDGYIMLMIVTVALVTQAFLSQNSTHLVTVEGARLKITLQSMLYEKCMRLAPWALRQTNINEESPLLQESNKTTTQSGLLTNLVSQDTYNIMSCVWVCHYIWAIPLKLIVLLYLLYTKLGISAIIGSTASVLFITPLQFYIGHKISKNSKDISQSTDHRISKMMEILRGINVIKLYVWEDLFKEKILNVREVELKLLNKDSLYWSFLTFTTQVSTLLVTVITFTVYYFVEDDNSLTAYNVFAGLALFNQLSVPLLILPVTVLMVIQAVVSTKRIKDFLELPESNNVAITNYENTCRNKKGLTKLNNAFVAVLPDDSTRDETEDPESGDKFSDDDLSPLANDKREYVVHFRNAAFSWGYKNDSMLEIDDLDIPSGKLIMIVGPTGAGKTSLLSAILGEMYLERGDAHWKGDCSMWYAGQPPWLLEGSVRENIVMDRPWNQRKYARIVRSTGLQPDLQLLPEGDNTPLGSNGEPLSGGQRVRVCVARALYSGARLLALDEPLGALDAALARRVVARALVPAARAGRTVLLATNRLEVLHYADVVIAMEGGCVTGCGRAWPAGAGEAVLSRWAQLAGEARAAAARGGAGPPGGSARERMHCVRALNRAKFQRVTTHDSLISISSATGAHFLPEVPACAGGSWRRDARARHALTRQFSSPPPSFHNYRCRQEVRRAVSADPSSAMLQRQVSLARRLLQGARQPRRTLARWTPKTFRRFLSTNSQTEENQTTANIDFANVLGWSAEQTEANWSETTDISATTNGMNEQIEQSGYKIPTNRDVNSELKIWWEYGRACGCWGAAFWVAAAAAQGLALAADCWLTHITGKGAETPLSSEQKWNSVLVYGALCLCGACVAGAAQAAQAAGGAAARRALHERLLQAALHSPPAAHAATPIGLALHRFSADVLVIDKKLPTALSRWAQLVLLCGAAVLVNAVAAPWTLLALLPAIFLYFAVQSVYLCNARELQHDEARSAAEVVSLAAQTAAGAGTVRAGRLQARMNDAFMTRLARNHNVLLILNSANRWLGLTMDLVGAGSVCVSVGVAVCGGGGGGGEGAVAGLAGAYSLLLPAYLAHLAKCRADLDQQLAAVERVSADTRLPQEDYREDCPIPSDWKREGKIQFENVTVQHEPGMPTILQDISLSISPGEKVVICGRSGSGKSSLLLACAGAAAVRRGRLLVDGRDAASVPLRALRRRVVLLPQEPHMFSGTLRENLDPLAVHTDDEIWQSLRAVGLQEFVAAQPAGLECIVCESGTACGGGGAGGWSGTRAARACGARAALRARWAGALLLDEPGAALDAAAERALLAALAAQAPAATVITVAHRVSSVRGYDRAVVLERGRVVEQGAVEELLAQPASRLARMLAAAQHTH